MSIKRISLNDSRTCESYKRGGFKQVLKDFEAEIIYWNINESDMTIRAHSLCIEDKLEEAEAVIKKYIKSSE